MTEQNQYKVVKVTEQSENVSQQVITITRDKLKIKIIESLDLINNRWSFLGPLGFVFTMIITFCTTDFKEFWIFDSKDVRGGFVAITLLGIVVLAIRIPKLLCSITVDEFIEKVKKEE